MTEQIERRVTDLEQRMHAAEQCVQKLPDTVAERIEALMRPAPNGTASLAQPDARLAEHTLALATLAEHLRTLEERVERMEPFFSSTQFDPNAPPPDPRPPGLSALESTADRMLEIGCLLTDIAQLRLNRVFEEDERWQSVDDALRKLGYL